MTMTAVAKTATVLSNRVMPVTALTLLGVLLGRLDDEFVVQMEMRGGKGSGCYFGAGRRTTVFGSVKDVKDMKAQNHCASDKERALEPNLAKYPSYPSRRS